MRVGVNPHVNGAVDVHGVGLRVGVRELDLKNPNLSHLRIELVLHAEAHRGSHDGSECKNRGNSLHIQSISEC